MPKGVSERFHCGSCFKTCSTRSNRFRHELSSHGNRELNCELCGTRFTRSDCLQRHEKICGKGSYSGNYKKNTTDGQFGGARNVTRALNGAAEDRVFYPRDTPSRNDLLHFLAQSQQPIITYLKSKLTEHAINGMLLRRLNFTKKTKTVKQLALCHIFEALHTQV